VRAALETGARYGELCRARVADFDPDAGTLYVRESKSGKPRHIPLDQAGRAFIAGVAAGRTPDALLFRREDGGAWGKSHQQRPLLEACANARIQPPASFHILRHTYASQRIMNGAPLIVIAQALGHGDTRMVEKHYGHLARGYVQQVIEATGMDLGDGPERPEVVRLQRF
jgi:integrase